MIEDPKTPAEWQDAVDAAEALLALDSARQYGLVTGGPTVNVDRCAEIIRRAAELHRIFPSDDAVARFAAGVAS